MNDSSDNEPLGYIPDPELKLYGIFLIAKGPWEETNLDVSEEINVSRPNKARKSEAVALFSTLKDEWKQERAF